uniref:Uncharacterized protein n=1 Tax=Octopus bimaculoides TaxID=37653 RepID=A0A0L8HVB8_OCTBM
MQPLQSTWACKIDAGSIILEMEKLLNGWISEKTQCMHINVNQASICSKALLLFSTLTKMKGDTNKLLLQAEDGLIDLKINMGDIPSKCKEKHQVLMSMQRKKLLL